MARHTVSGILQACAGWGRALGGGAGAPVSPRRCSGWRTARSLRLAAVLGHGCGAWAGRAGSAALTWRGSVLPRRPALQETLFAPKSSSRGSSDGETRSRARPLRCACFPGESARWPARLGEDAPRPSAEGERARSPEPGRSPAPRAGSAPAGDPREGVPDEIPDA